MDPREHPGHHPKRSEVGEYKPAVNYFTVTVTEHLGAKSRILVRAENSREAVLKALAEWSKMHHISHVDVENANLRGVLD